MDHTLYENYMIDIVNRNAAAAEQVRNERILKAQEAQGQMRRRKAADATIESIALSMTFLSLMALAWVGVIPAEYALVGCSTFGFIAGMRISTLAGRIKRYGGRA